MSKIFLYILFLLFILMELGFGQVRGMRTEAPRTLVNGESTDTFTTLTGCEAQDIYREIFLNDGSAGSVNSVRNSWESNPTPIGNYGFSNQIEAECRMQPVPLEGGEGRLEYSCSYGGSLQMRINGVPAELPREGNWSVDQIIQENGRPILSGGAVALSSNPNQTSRRVLFRGESAANLRRALVETPGSFAGNPIFNNGQLTYIWMHYHYIRAVNVRIRNSIFCNDMGTECTLSTEYLLYMPYTERERCGEQNPGPIS